MTMPAAAIFDWAGTVVDFGCLAPVEAFRAAFATEGVPVSDAEARAPMGLPKRAHIAAVLAGPRVAAAWMAAKGAPAGEADIDRLYAAFLPLQAGMVTRHADAIEGAAETLARLRAAGVRLGSTTGYARALMDLLEPLAAAQGIAFAVTVTPDGIPDPRPGPGQMRSALAALGAPDPARCIKIDDTPAGIAEGIACGAWTVGIARSGNGMGLSPEALAALDPAEQWDREQAVEDALYAAGANAVIPTVAELGPVVEQIGRWIAAGRTPHRVTP